MPNKNVIFVNRFYYPDHSATSQILTDLTLDLASGGAQVLVLTSRLKYDEPRTYLPSEETVRGVAVRRVWSTSFGRELLFGRALDYLSFYASIVIALLRYADRGTVVVVKTDPPLLSVFAAPVIRLRGARLVNWLQDVFPEVAAALGIKLVRGCFLRLLENVRDRSLRAAAVNVVLGQRMMELVLSRGVSPQHVRVIPNWADSEAIRPIDRDVNSLRHEWKLQDQFVVCYSGNLGRAHEVATVLDAMQNLAERDDIHFVFIGGGAQLSSVTEATARAGLRNVSFRPYQPRERLSESLSVGDVHLVLLHPSMEGLIVPSKFYGVAAAGRPTLFVGDADGEIAQVVREYDCGYVVNPGEGRLLAERIRALADDPVGCARMGSNARIALETRFDRRLAVQLWKQVLET